MRILEENAMSRRIIDLSVPLENECPSNPKGFGPQIEYQSHKDTADTVISIFTGLQKSQLPDGEGWAMEHVKLTTHDGTHLDAPWHYSTKMDGNKRAITNR